MRVAVIGAGGHAKVVVDALEVSGASIAGVVDEREGPVEMELLGHVIVRSLDRLSADAFVVAIGDNAKRQKRFEALVGAGLSPATVVHPSAVIARDVAIGPGTVVFAGVVVNRGATIGTNVILNTGCTVDHDCMIGDHSHVAPGVSLCGAVEVGAGCLVGVGCSVAPSCRIGTGTVVGAGSAVIGDLPTESVCVGSPARPVSRGGCR